MSASKPLRFFLSFLGLGLVSWFILTSFYASVNSFIVQGNVQALIGDPIGSKVWYTSNPRETDTQQMRFIDVRANGNFKAVINVEPNSPVYFYAIKEGYTPSRVRQIIKESNQPTTIPTINISTLHEVRSYGQMANPDLLPNLAIYTGKDCPDALANTIRLDHISYFENLRLVNCFSNNPDTKALSATLNINGRIGYNSAFVLLKRTANGLFLAIED